MTGKPSATRQRAGGRDDAAGRGAAALAAARAGPGPIATVRAGVREPIVVVLLLIAFFTSISGKPLDGLLMLVAGVSLAWDTARRSRRASPTASGPHGDGQPDRSQDESGPADLSPPELHHSVDRAGAKPAAPGTITGETAPAASPGVERDGTLARQGEPLAARPRRRLLPVGWLAGGALYALVVSSFSRYSWPATVPVVGLGVAVIVAGWRGPRHSRPAPARLPTAGLALWGLVLVAGCLWELSSLLQQPTLTTSSYAHPTISTLTDPALSTWAGRSIVLAGWLGLGWFLVER
ncbi:MAG: hypothetical protein ACTHPS_19640 [Streptosporangiaceae bacterium]